MAGAATAHPLTEANSRRWSREEYHRLADEGWFEGQHVQLIGGEIIEMPPQKGNHAFAIRLADHQLRKAFPSGFVICNQQPFRVPGSSEPEPDLCVVKGAVREIDHHPRHAELVVEVADTTLRFDRNRKASLYACAGVPDYWIVNLIDRCVEVHRDSIADSAEPFGYRYATVATLRSGESIAALHAPAAPIAVADLLP